MQSSMCKGNVPHNSRVCRVLGTLLKSVNPSKSPATVRPLPTDEDYVGIDFRHQKSLLRVGIAQI